MLAWPTGKLLAVGNYAGNYLEEEYE